MERSRHNKQRQGFGLGLRPDHYETILSGNVAVDWFEIITEHYLIPGGKTLRYLEQIRERFPMAMHGMSLSIGGVDPIDMSYLREVKSLRDRLQPLWISDHLGWTGTQSLNMHDQLPLLYTEETIAHVTDRIRQVQDFLGERLLIENISSYVTFRQSTMTEWEFLSEISRRADCQILLDVNSVYVGAMNHGFDPMDYIRHLPAERVRQLHLASHTSQYGLVIDTHDREITDPVWHLYQETLKHVGMIDTVIERDEHIPPLHELVRELNHARKIASHVFSEVI